MRVSAARHVRRTPRRRWAVAVAAAVFLAGLPALTVQVSPASAGETCVLTPQLSEVMVNQGLPSYKEFTNGGKKEYKLVRGKTTLVKYFLRLPGCAPNTTDVRVVGGQLFTTISPAKIDSSGNLVLPPASDILATTTTTGVLPAPPVGPTATAPVPEAASDPLFIVPGSALKPSSVEEKRVYFAAVLQYTVNGGGAQTLNLLTVPATGDLVSRVIDRDVRPMRVLVVPMGDAGTVREPKTYDSQFPGLAQTELERGLKALSRVLPVPDHAGEPLTGTNSGLRTGMSAGLLTLGPHDEDGKTVNYMPDDGPYCGALTHFGYIGSELQKRRTAHNSVNKNAQAEFAYGAIWQDRSLGKTTGTTSPTCIEGAGSVPGRVAWGRLVAPVPDVRAGVSGTIAAMELTHNAGRVAPDGDDRYVTGYHSNNSEADVTAVDRAWNTMEHRWISQDRSIMSDGFTGWNDSNTLLEQKDWDGFHCLLTSAACATGDAIGVGAAGADAPTFYLSGSFAGFGDEEQGNEHVDVASYYLEKGKPEAADSSSPYLFVQRKGDEVLNTAGIPVAAAVDEHDDGTATHGGEGVDVFGVQLPAAAGVDRVQIYYGGVAPENLLYERSQGSVPQFVSVSAANRTASVSATGSHPENLRLDLFLACPEMTSPLAVDLHPLVVGGIATFTTTYDTTLGCGDAGQLLYRINDGYLTRTQTGVTDIDDDVALAGVAAIYAPTTGASVTESAPIPLAGAARDGTGLPADRLEWRLAPKGQQLPSEPTFVGGTGSVKAPDGGFVVGAYTVSLRAFRKGIAVGQATTEVTILPDEDDDLMPDPVEPPCYPNAASDGRNATRDSDSDGAADVVDVIDHDGNGLIDVLHEYAPCTSTSTAQVTFDPQKLQKGSSGVPVTVRLRSDEIDLVQLKATGAQLFIHKVAGYRVSIPANSWSVEVTLGGVVAEAKFSRDALNKALNDGGVLGYVPVFVGTADRHLYGADPQYPIVFP
jgi:hypothetical protein